MQPGLAHPKTQPHLFRLVLRPSRETSEEPVQFMSRIGSLVSAAAQPDEARPGSRVKPRVLCPGPPHTQIQLSSQRDP